jgi:hypothetical protein
MAGMTSFFMMPGGIVHVGFTTMYFMSALKIGVFVYAVPTTVAEFQTGRRSRMK